MEVSVGGVAVANGSTLSTTGLMEVSCNVPYVLTVDNVEWSPISSVDGIDTYVLSTSGVVRVSVNGIRYFFFINNLNLDFSISKAALFQKASRQEDNLKSTWSNGSYVQDTLVNNCHYVVVYVGSSTMTTEQLSALEVTVSQGLVDETRVAGSYLTIWVRDVNPSNYMMVHLGNVLTAFASASE